MKTASEPGQRSFPAGTTTFVSRLDGLDAIGALAHEWDELDAELAPRTPFTGSLWNQLWWKHYCSRRLMVKDELFAHVARDDAGNLLAIAPMMLTRRPSRGPVQGRVLQCFGTDPNVTEIRGIICRPRDQATVLRALAAHYSAGGKEWDWIDWGGFREDGTAGQVLAGAGVLGWDRQTPTYFLSLPSSWDELRAGLGRNIKESLRKCYNSLKRDHHTFTLKVVESPAQVPAALETFFRLHRARAHADAGHRHADVFVLQKDREFLSEYALAMAARGQLRIFQLEIAGQVVATRVAFVLGDELYLYYSGYDMRWARYSVMTTVVAEAIKWAIEQRLRVVNLSTGDDVSKTRWRPQSVTFRSAVQISRGWRAHTAYRAYNSLHQIIGSRDTLLGKLSRMVRR